MTDMRASPYRSAAHREEPPTPRGPAYDGPVRVLVLALWVASIIRAGRALLRDEILGAEPTIAIMESFRAQ